MTSVAYGVAPTVSLGNDYVNARQLDAQFKMLIDRINALIAALNVMRDGRHAWFKDRSVRWRMFSQQTIQELREIIAATKAIRQTRQIIYSVFDPRLDFTLLPWPDFKVSGSNGLWFKHNLSSTTPWYIDAVPPLQTGLLEIVYWTRAMMEATVVRPASWPVHQWFTHYTALPTGFFADTRLFMVDRTLTTDHIDIAVENYDHMRAEVRDTQGNTVYEYILNGIYVPASTGLSPTNPWPVQLVAEQYGWMQSSRMTIVCRPGWEFRIRYRNDDNNGIFSSYTNYPPDDERFPYRIRHRDGVGWQLDLLHIRKLSENRLPVTLLTQTGGWLEGAGPMGFIEIEEQDAASY